jgi:hypothetical protein
MNAAGGESELLPPFPWPPPPFSFIGEFGKDVPRECLGTDETTLGEIYSRLYAALKAVDKGFESGLFGAPGGFVMLARMERVNEDGTPFPGGLRWTREDVPPLNLVDYFGQLFMENPGYFRVIAFVITDKINFGQGDKSLPDIPSGTDLPPEIRALSFRGRNCSALIYSFKRKPGASMTEIRNLSMDEHLRKSGVLNALLGSN